MGRPEFTKACAGQKASAVSKLAAEEWKKVSDAQKATYQKKYDEVKAKFENDMAAFLAAGGEKVKGTRALRTEKRKEKDGKLKKKDPNAPKKPASGGYGVFMAENRERIVKSLPKDHKITDVCKAVGEEWKALSEEKKKPYLDKYEKRAAEYKAAMEEYKRTHGGEAEECEDEEDEEANEEEEEESPKKKSRKVGV